MLHEIAKLIEVSNLYEVVYFTPIIRYMVYMCLHVHVLPGAGDAGCGFFVLTVLASIIYGTVGVIILRTYIGLFRRHKTEDYSTCYAHSVLYS